MLAHVIKAQQKVMTAPEGTLEAMLECLQIKDRVWPKLEREELTDVAALEGLTKADLKEVGIPLGHANKIVNTIQKLQEKQWQFFTVTDAEDDLRPMGLTQRVAFTSTLTWLQATTPTHEPNMDQGQSQGLSLWTIGSVQQTPAGTAGHSVLATALCSIIWT